MCVCLFNDLLNCLFVVVDNDDDDNDDRDNLIFFTFLFSHMII